MRFGIEPLRKEHLPAVRMLNRRLSAGGVEQGFLLPESVPDPVDRKQPIFKEQYVVASERGVHGGFMLQHQDFSINGRIEKIGNYQMPISEGVIDRDYAPIGILMLREALKIHPCLFALGMGGRDNRLPRMLQAMGWRLWDMPFLFHIHNPARFLRHIVPLRSTAPRRLLLDAVAMSGFGWVGIRLMQFRRPMRAAISTETVDRFGSWADEIWEQSRTSFSLCAHRSSEMLNLRYPPGQERYLRIKIRKGDTPIGWVVLLDTQMQQSQYFGSLRVGSIIDSMAVPGETALTMSAALAELYKRGVDLTVSNQSHEGWVSALRRCGFLSGASNFVFAASQKLCGQIVSEPSMHISRGDGEGALSL